MSVGETSGPIHPVPTRRSGLRYQFYDKHHGRGAPDAARWLPSLGHDEEESLSPSTPRTGTIADERGWLYGVCPRDNAGEIPDLGIWEEKVAEFPFARPEETWHGYPLWPLSAEGPATRRGEKARTVEGRLLADGGSRHDHPPREETLV